VSHANLINVADMDKGDRVMNICRLLRLPEVIETTGLGRDTIHRYIREGRFPRQRRISKRANGWREDEIKTWVDSRPTVERVSRKYRRFKAGYVARHRIELV
jgi:prophage regulatory protein